MHRYLDVTRKVYDESRGLSQDCKYPERSDAELKAYMLKSSSNSSIPGSRTANPKPPPTTSAKSSSTSKKRGRKVKKKAQADKCKGKNNALADHSSGSSDQEGVKTRSRYLLLYLLFLAFIFFIV